ncbi:hypothetical protein D3C75_1368250 [compost metagenome]
MICRSKAGKASRMASMAKSGRLGARSPRFTPGLYDGSTLPRAVDGLPATKSPTNWAGAW